MNIIDWFKNELAEIDRAEELERENGELKERNIELAKTLAECNDITKKKMDEIEILTRGLKHADKAIDGLHKQIGTEKQNHAKTLQTLRKQTEADILATGLRALGILPTTEREGVHREQMHNLVQRLESIDRKISNIQHYTAGANPLTQFTNEMRAAGAFEAMRNNPNPLGAYVGGGLAAGAVPGMTGRKLEDGGVL